MVKTILFDTKLNKPVNGLIRDGKYMVDGTQPVLPSHIIELEVMERDELQKQGYWRRNENHWEYKEGVDNNGKIGFWESIINIFKT